ncbi:hypothetical protein D3C77_477460 [compost metagenome]
MLMADRRKPRRLLGFEEGRERRRFRQHQLADLCLEFRTQRATKYVWVVVNRCGSPEHAQGALVDEAARQVVIGAHAGDKRGIHAFVQQGIQGIVVGAGIHLCGEEPVQRDADSVRKLRVGDQAAGGAGGIGERHARATKLVELLDLLARQQKRLVMLARWGEMPFVDGQARKRLDSRIPLMGKQVGRRPQPGHIGAAGDDGIDHALVGTRRDDFHRPAQAFAQVPEQRLIFPDQHLHAFFRDQDQAHAVRAAFGQDRRHYEEQQQARE